MCIGPVYYAGQNLYAVSMFLEVLRSAEQYDSSVENTLNSGKYRVHFLIPDLAGIIPDDLRNDEHLEQILEKAGLF